MSEVNDCAAVFTTERVLHLCETIKEMFPDAQVGGYDDFDDGMFLFEVLIDPHLFTMTCEKRGYGVSYISIHDLPEFDMNTVQDAYHADFAIAKAALLEKIQRSLNAPA